MDTSYLSRVSMMFVILVHLEATSNSALAEPFILFANQAFIHRMNLDGTEFTTVVSQNSAVNTIIGLDYDIRQEYMFWTDRDQKVIMRARFNGTEATTLVSSGLGVPDGVAWDWVNKKLYWTDAKLKQIKVFDPATGDRKVLISTGEDSLPRAIVVDPSTRWLYWTDWGSSPHIERASMDGTNQTILHSTNLTWPNALTLDYENQVLYWADAKTDIIEYSNADGTGRSILAVQVNRTITHPFSITFYNDRLYWSDWGPPDEVRSLAINNPETITTIAQGFGDNPTGLHVVTAERQAAQGNNPCGNNNGGCTDLCLLSAVAPEGYSCACPEGIEPSPRCLFPVPVSPTPTPSIVQDLCASVATTTVITSLVHSTLTTVYLMPSPTPTQGDNPCMQKDLCHNGGSCFSNSLLEYVCKCQDGYEGRHCEDKKIIPADICATSAPCKNGGSCVNTLDGDYVCVCIQGYQGTDCESFFLTENSTEKNELQSCTGGTGVSAEIFVGVIGGLVLVIVLILLFGMTAFCTVMRKEHQKNVTYSVESSPQLLRRSIPSSCDPDYMSIKSCSPAPRAQLYTTVDHGTSPSHYTTVKNGTSPSRYTTVKNGTSPSRYTTVKNGTSMRSNGVPSEPPRENGVGAPTVPPRPDPFVGDNPAYDSVQYKLQTL